MKINSPDIICNARHISQTVHINLYELLITLERE